MWFIFLIASTPESKSWPKCWTFDGNFCFITTECSVDIAKRFEWVEWNRYCVVANLNWYHYWNWACLRDANNWVKRYILCVGHDSLSFLEWNWKFYVCTALYQQSWQLWASICFFTLMFFVLSSVSSLYANWVAVSDYHICERTHVNIR